MNLTYAQIDDIENISGLEGFFLLQAPSQVHFCSDNVSKTPEHLMALYESLMSMARLSSRGDLHEIKANHNGGHLLVKVIRENNETFYLGILMESAKKETEIIQLVINSLAE